MTSIPTSTRIAIGFIIALWTVGLAALAVGAPGEIVVAAATIGTAGACVEWSGHRREVRRTMAPADDASGGPAAVRMRYETGPKPDFRRKH